MKRIITTLYISIFIAGMAMAQTADFSYQVKRDVMIPVYKVVNFKNHPITWGAKLSQVKYEAPMPDMLQTGAKAKVNQMRKERIAAVRAKKGYDAPATSGEVVPTSDRGFQGAIPVSTPNDNHCAVSKNGTVISVINQVIRATDSDGNLLMESTLEDFPQDSLGNLTRSFDPKVMYDEKEDKFIFVYLEGNGSLSSKIIVAFSETNDPTGNWFVYAVTGNPLDDKSWSDYPIIGISDKDFYLTLNLLKNGGTWQEGFKESIIWQIDKQSGYTGKDLGTNLFHDIKYKDRSVWSICPVQGGLNPTSPGMYFLSVRPGDFQNDSVFLHTVDNTQASGIAKIDLRVLTTDIKYGVPPSALQPAAGYKLQTNDARVLSAIYHDNTIQYVQTTVDMNTLTSSIYHGIIRNVIWPSVTYVKGHIISSDSVDYAYPSIAYAGVGGDHQSAMLTFSHVSSTTFAGTSVLYYDGLGLYSDVVRVRDGDGLVDVPFLADSLERWGDYTQIQRKYDEPGVFWLSGSFGAADNKPATWVAEIKNGDTRNFSVSAKGYSPVTGKMLVFPNPAATRFNTEITVTTDHNNVNFALYDMQGKQVADLLTIPALSQGTHQFSFNTANLVNGTYILRVKQANGIELYKERIVVAR